MYNLLEGALDFVYLFISRSSSELRFCTNCIIIAYMNEVILKQTFFKSKNFRES
jgi:hypothetical protein